MNCLLIHFELAVVETDFGFRRGALRLVPMIMVSIVSCGDCY